MNSQGDIGDFASAFKHGGTGGFKQSPHANTFWDRGRGNCRHGRRPGVVGWHRRLNL
jgi:hypothetical protein